MKAAERINTMSVPFSQLSCFEYDGNVSHNDSLVWEKYLAFARVSLSPEHYTFLLAKSLVSNVRNGVTRLM